MGAGSTSVFDSSPPPPPPPLPPEPVLPWRSLGVEEATDGVAYEVFDARATSNGTCIGVDLRLERETPQFAGERDFSTCFAHNTLRMLRIDPLIDLGYDVGSFPAKKTFVALLRRPGFRLTGRLDPRGSSTAIADGHRIAVFVYDSHERLRALTVKNRVGKPVGSCSVHERSLTVRCHAHR
jgi:hypothetical protein